MTPVYFNGNDYYKKMLELQRRLRQSEEERIRLEERFSLLEHESRSRHEACINRLRMRYIEFLEEQQARDERNHKLLGALDRVDSSLALISANTDRLGSMRRQYEAASLLKNWCANRASESVTGDSGVASQYSRTGGNRFEEVRTSSKRSETFVPTTRGVLASSVGSSAGSARALATPRPYSSTREPLNYGYEPLRAENTGYNPQLSSYPSSMPTTLLRKSESSFEQPDRRTVPQSFIRTRPSAHLLQQTPPKYQFDYPTRTSSNAYEPTTSLFSPTKPPKEPYAYSSNPEGPRPARRASILGKETFKKFPLVQNYSGYFEDDILSSAVRSASRLSKPLNESASRLEEDEENEYRVGGIVENELEMYMSRIPQLYRDADCSQNPEDVDLEQNTSGDLLNVSLSESGVDISAEGKSRRDLPGRGLLEESKNSSERRLHPVSRGSAAWSELSPSDGSNSIEKTGSREKEEARTGAAPDKRLGNEFEQVRIGYEEKTSAAEGESRELSSITPVSEVMNADDGLVVEKTAPRAKNRIRPDVERDRVESATRSAKNNENAEESKSENSDGKIDRRERRASGSAEKREAVAKPRERMEGLSSDENEDAFSGSKFRVVNSEQRDTENNFQEQVEELEPWTLRGLERKVENWVVLHEDPDFVQDNVRREPGDDWQDREAGGEGEGDVDADQVRRNQQEQQMNDYSPTQAPNSDINKQQTEHFSEEYDFSRDTDASFTKNESNNESGGSPEESGVVPSGDYHSEAAQLNPEYEDNAYTAEGSTAYPQEGQYSEDPNLQYEYPGQGQYQEGADGGQYEQQLYDEQGNVQYSGEAVAGQEYQYGTEGADQYQAYSVDQAYTTGQGGEYVADGHEAYADGNQGYVVDPSQEYLPEGQEYAEGGPYMESENGGYPVNQGEGYPVNQSEAYPIPVNGGYSASQNEAYPQDYPEAQDYSQAYVKGSEEVEGLANELNTSQVYEQGEGAPAEPDSSQDYMQNEGVPSGVVDNSQAYNQEYQTSAQPDNSQAYDPGAAEQAPEDEASVQEEQSPGKLLSEESVGKANTKQREEASAKKTKDVIKSLLDSDTESTIERNVSNTESDFDFN